MIEQIEKEINIILQQNTDIKAKHQQVLELINSIESDRIKKVFLYAYGHYNWDILPEFKLNEFEKIKADEYCHFPEWAENVFDYDTWRKGFMLLDQAKNMLSKRNLPFHLYKLISDELNKKIKKSGKSWENDTFCVRDFKYSFKNIPGQNISITIIEDRTRKQEHKLETFIEHYDIKYENGHAITDSRLALSDNKKNALYNHSHTQYVDSKEVFTEFCQEEKDALPYTRKEIAFIKSLGIVNSKSVVFKNAIKNSLCYSSTQSNNYYFHFDFYKNKSVLTFNFSIKVNGMIAYIYGNQNEVKVSILSTEIKEPAYTLTFDDFVKNNNKDAVLIIEQLINLLQSLGVSVIIPKEASK